MLRDRLVQRLSLNEGLKLEYQREVDWYFRLWMLSGKQEPKHLERALKALHRIEFLGEVNDWITELLDDVQD